MSDALEKARREAQDEIQEVLDEIYGWANTPHAQRCLAKLGALHRRELETARLAGRLEQAEQSLDIVLARDHPYCVTILKEIRDRLRREAEHE